MVCSMRLGEVDFGSSPLVLAPMEDVTDRSFRVLCKEYGADWLYSEFVNAEGLVRGAGHEKLVFDECERPYTIQLYGERLPSLVESARIVEEEGKPDFIDLNAGCPVKKIALRGAGAGMLRTPDFLVEVAGAIVRQVHCPVTVKLRLGWDSEHIIAGQLCERLQDVGVSAVAIHGRTRAQLYTGQADWDAIARVKANPRLRIPVIGNGDITTPETCKEAFARYGVDGVMVGRGSIGRPWIFGQMRHYLDTGVLASPPSLHDLVVLARRHLALSLHYKGEKRGLYEFRRHLCMYFKSLPHFREYRLRMVTEENPCVLDDLILGIEDRWGGA